MRLLTSQSDASAPSLAPVNHDTLKEFSMYRIRNRQRPSGGFTLIEVLLVLVILVVLASLAVVAYGPILKGMKVKQAKTQIGLFKTAINAYNLDVGNYPQKLEDLVIPPGDVPQGKWLGPYLDSAGVPQDPWSKHYSYTPQSSHNLEFDIWTVDPAGVEIGNWTP
jgi:general secretion pathway protein G